MYNLHSQQGQKSYIFNKDKIVEFEEEFFSKSHFPCDSSIIDEKKVNAGSRLSNLLYLHV